MGNAYLEAITPEDHDCDDFHPKDSQNPVYKWYDRQYSKEAWDIYSSEWEERILVWHEAHQIVLQETSRTLKFDDKKLESLPFGIFFLAHPIAAFSLWRVLQACYGLDRAVCGEAEEAMFWQELPPFQYLKDPKVDKKWEYELDRFKQELTGTRSKFKRQSWELQLTSMIRGIENFEKEFLALEKNFKVNLKGTKIGPWILKRIEVDIGRRMAMITEMLKLTDNGLLKIQQTESHEDDINDADTFSAPGYSRTATFPPSYPSPVQSNFPHRTVQAGNKTLLEPDSLQQPAKQGGLFSDLKKNIRKIRRKIRKPKDSKNVTTRSQ